MSRTLIIEVNGSISIKEWVYDEEKEKGEYEIAELFPSDVNILGFLQYSIDLEEGFTLRDYFKLILNFTELQNLDGYFKDFIEEYNKCPDEGCFEDNMPTIQISRLVQITKWNDKDKMKDSIEIYVQVDGSTTEENGIPWSFGFSHLDKLLDTPIILKDTTFYIDDYNMSVQERTEQGFQTYKTDYTLWEFISSIIYELSWYGNPIQRDTKGEELNQITKDIKEGKCELIPMEEIFND